jgi:hypothetical protein
MGILSGTRLSGVFKSGSPHVTNPPSTAENAMLSIVWLLGGVLTILIPVFYRTKKMNDYKQMYYMWNWEEAQRQWQEKQQQYYENYENQYAQQWNQGAYQWEQMRGTYDINQCKWWQFNCFPYYINENGEPEPAAGWYPAWFSGWTVTEQEREQMLEDGDTSAALKFVYAWQIIMFIAILVYGFFVIRQNRIVTGLIVALIVFANMSFLGMWMLADGSIITDGEFVQKIGFYGQFPVLMFITNAWYVAFGVIFSIVFAIRGHSMHKIDAKKQNQDITSTSYRTLDEDDIKQSGKDDSLESIGDDYVKVV